MSIVIDTSVMVEHPRGNVITADALAAAIRAEERLCASEVSRIELLAGYPSRQGRRLDRLFEAFEWLPLNEQVARAAGELMGSFGPSHRGVDIADCAIAATATTLGARLWTLNIRHFPMFPRLEPPF